MNLKNKPPIFVPPAYCAEIERYSKAALMDMVWDFAQRCAGMTDDNPRKVFEEIERTGEIVRVYREEARRPLPEKAA